ncbi:MAG: hypothetical protein HC888_10305 [Candidatus Competibacteraceae bacterium]|nr:hypothetical protein [Candidatus Competibacteraceae bacterium]
MSRIRWVSAPLGDLEDAEEGVPTVFEDKATKLRAEVLLPMKWDLPLLLLPVRPLREVRGPVGGAVVDRESMSPTILGLMLGRPSSALWRPALLLRVTDDNFGLGLALS